MTRDHHLDAAISPPCLVGEQIRVYGIVQGVGFRPTVWRLANVFGIRGQVLNDGEGVILHAYSDQASLDAFVERLYFEQPTLARIDHIEREPLNDSDIPEDFSIATSEVGPVSTGITADAATCPACLEETLSPFSRRYRYPFTNCTHCGPRLSIIYSVPYDRERTSMSGFILCPQCQQEYESPADRRFHAQPIACHACGPRAWLERTDGRAMFTETLTQLDDVDAACSLLKAGEILAIKGIGGFHLACDATDVEAVNTLRRRKRRDHKPFALMARDLDIIRRYCRLSDQETKLLQSAEAPIVILDRQGCELPASVAPGQTTLGFMLPYTPLHHLLLKRMDRPIVLTSGNRSDEPQYTDNEEARSRLGEIADYMLCHNRDIVNRVDDSVVRVVASQTRIIRRARGFSPATLDLPPGFENSPSILAMGGELKNTFCLVIHDKAIISQHMGDLADAATYADYQKNLALYQHLYPHALEQISIDEHPEYLSSKLGRLQAETQGLPICMVQHHHAHIAACLAENARSITAPPVLGIALDGLGYGSDGTLWGGEFLLADYCEAKRLGTFKPVALPGGAMAMREPWRNTYAHLIAEMGWVEFLTNFKQLELARFFESKPLDTLDAMIRTGTNAPLASSCGRLFDAVAAAMGICRERASYEGQAAMELEAMVDRNTLWNEDEALAYPFTIPNLANGLPYIEPLAMWRAVLGDRILETPVSIMAARFHKGLAKAIVKLVKKLTTRDEQRIVDTVALSGGVFQNRTLFEQVVQRLETEKFHVLSHRLLPANDGGLSFGQAMVAAARSITFREH
ncbi:MAG: carbamoyltransferase HypF [Gammaproteobacteria bacterium]